MISMGHMKKLSKSKPTDVWCLDTFGEHLMRFDRLSLCSQINAIPIEDVVDMLTELQLDIEKHTMTSGITNQGTWNECIACCSRVIQEKINSLKEKDNGK